MDFGGGGYSILYSLVKEMCLILS